MPLFRVVALPFCTVLMREAWNAPPGRHFLAYRTRHGYRWLMGHPVVDEFGTLSSPILIAAAPLLGKIYNAGISLGHRRDSEMAIDLGWPPFCIGLDEPAPTLPADWEQQLLSAITAPPQPGGEATSGSHRSARAGDFDLEHWYFGGPAPQSQISVLATSAPLMPAQLGRLAELDTRALTVAVATGNRVTRQEAGRPQELRAVSEGQLAVLGTSLQTILR